MLWARRSRLRDQGVGAAKVVDDVGGGAPLGRVPARLGELVVLTVEPFLLWRLVVRRYMPIQ